MRLHFRSAFAVLGLIAAAIGLACTLLGAYNLLSGDRRSAALLAFGLFAFVLGAGLWTWAQRSAEP
jgi:hypothetical protein